MAQYTKTIKLVVDGIEVRVRATSESPDINTISETIRQLRKIERILTQLHQSDI